MNNNFTKFGDLSSIMKGGSFGNNPYGLRDFSMNRQMADIANINKMRKLSESKNPADRAIAVLLSAGDYSDEEVINMLADIVFLINTPRHTKTRDVRRYMDSGQKFYDVELKDVSKALASVRKFDDEYRSIMSFKKSFSMGKIIKHLEELEFILKRLSTINPAFTTIKSVNTTSKQMIVSNLEEMEAVMDLYHDMVKRSNGQLKTSELFDEISETCPLPSLRLAIKSGKVYEESDDIFYQLFDFRMIGGELRVISNAVAYKTEEEAAKHLSERLPVREAVTSEVGIVKKLEENAVPHIDEDNLANVKWYEFDNVEAIFGMGAILDRCVSVEDILVKSNEKRKGVYEACAAHMFAGAAYFLIINFILLHPIQKERRRKEKKEVNAKQETRKRVGSTPKKRNNLLSQISNLRKEYERKELGLDNVQHHDGSAHSYEYVRRGHWHTYWRGHGEDKKPVRVWLESTTCCAGRGEKVVSAIRPVFQDLEGNIIVNSGK